MHNGLTKSLCTYMLSDVFHSYPDAMEKLRDELVSELKNDVISFDVWTARGDILKSIRMLCNELASRKDSGYVNTDEYLIYTNNAINLFVEDICNITDMHKLWNHYDTLCSELDYVRSGIKSRIRECDKKNSTGWESSINDVLNMPVAESSSNFTCLVSLYANIMLDKFYKDTTSSFVRASVLTQDILSVYSYSDVGIMYDYGAICKTAAARPREMSTYILSADTSVPQLKLVSDLMLLNLRSPSIATDPCGVTVYHSLTENVYLHEPLMEQFLDKVPSGSIPELFLLKPVKPAGFLYLSNIDKTEKSSRVKHLGMGLGLPVFKLDKEEKRITRII